MLFQGDISTSYVYYFCMLLLIFPFWHVQRKYTWKGGEPPCHFPDISLTLLYEIYFYYWNREKDFFRL